MTGIPGNLTAHFLAIVLVWRGEEVEGGGRSLDVVRYFPPTPSLTHQEDKTRTRRHFLNSIQLALL